MHECGPREWLYLLVEHVGRDHPLTLEVGYALVAEYKVKARPSEALTTSNDLYIRARQFFSSTSQQSIHYRFQYASLNIWMGKHVQGLGPPAKICNLANEKWGKSYGWSL